MTDLDRVRWRHRKQDLLHVYLISFISAIVALATVSASAKAAPFEIRTYLDIGAKWSPALERAPNLHLGPFVREESRFHEDGLTYVKASAGARANFLSWLRAAVYYAHKDFPGSDRQQAHMAVLDVFFDFDIGPVVGFDKSGFEAHVTDGFFRYRNALELRWEGPHGWFAPFARGELRVDSDATRINMLDAWVGLLLRIPGKVHSHLSLRTFYGYETNRRGKPSWMSTHLLGVAFVASL